MQPDLKTGSTKVLSNVSAPAIMHNLGNYAVKHAASMRIMVINACVEIIIAVFMVNALIIIQTLLKGCMQNAFSKVIKK